MIHIDTATAEKLLYLGIAVILAAIVGGGLDAASVIQIPQLRDWRIQVGVGAFGLIVMVFAVIGLSDADTSTERQAWETSLNQLAQGAVGIPEPAWKPDIIRFDLVGLLNRAGDDYDENCEIAAFVLEFSDRLDYVPEAIKARMVNPLPTKSTVCYQESLQVAQRLQTQAGTPAAKQSSPVGYLAEPRLVVASRDFPITAEMLRPRTVENGVERVAVSSAERLLESATAVGDEGYIYVGHVEMGELDSSRTIQESSAVVGRIVTVRGSVNLRSIGSDSDYRNHTVYRVLSSGTKVIIKSVATGPDAYEWARVKVTFVPQV